MKKTHKTTHLTVPNVPKNQKRNSRINQYAKYAGIPFQMIAIVGIGAYGGIKLDEYTQNQDSLYTMICSFVAVCVAMIVIIRQVKKDSKNSK